MLHFKLEVTKYNKTVELKLSEDGARWEPWNPTIPVVLRRKRNPIPMYARRARLAMPAFDVPIGYDLEVGDWTAPHGGGQKTDMIFTAQRVMQDNFNYDYELTVSFPNEGDGIQAFEAGAFEGSEFKSFYEAPIEGYREKWVQSRKRSGAYEKEKGNQDPSRNYMIRVRTLLDDHGRVIQANYGKIHGDFLEFIHYLNPTPNDRNLEFDPSKNLTYELKRGDQVTNP